jgi:hypothetical protein
VDWRRAVSVYAARNVTENGHKSFAWIGSVDRLKPKTSNDTAVVANKRFDPIYLDQEQCATDDLILACHLFIYL